MSVLAYLSKASYGVQILDNIVYGVAQIPYSWYPLYNPQNGEHVEVYLHSSYETTVQFEVGTLESLVFSDQIESGEITINKGADVVTSIDTKTLPVGSYDYKIVYTNTGTEKHIYVDVIVDQSSPYVSQLPDLEFEVGTALPKWLVWLAKDSSPSTYEIFKDGVMVQDSSWITNDPISYDITSLGIGTYHFKIEAKDVSGKITSSSLDVEIIADTTPPILHNF